MRRRRRVKLRRVWISGDEPGVGVFEVDPPLLPGEVEIDLSSVERPTELMSPLELAAYEDMTR